MVAAPSRSSSGGGSGGGGQTMDSLFGTNLKFHLDTENPYAVSLTGSNNNQLVTMTTSDSSHLAVQSLSGQRTIWNGHSMYTRGATYMQVPSSTALYNFLHNGTGMTIGFRLYVHALPASSAIILDNCSGSTGNVGFTVTLASTGNIALAIRRGVGGSSKTVITTDAPIAVRQWCNVIFTQTGVNLSAYIGTTLKATDSTAFAHSSSAAFGNMTWFRLSGTGTYANDILIKNPFFLDRTITTQEISSVQSVMAGTKDFGHNGVANVYKMDGQSNMSGRGSYAGSPAYLGNATGAKMYNITDNVPDAITNTWADHQWNVNTSTENQSLVGPDLEFAYRMNLIAPGTIYILKYAVTGSSMKVATEPDKDWNYTSTTNDLAYRSYDQQLVYALKELKYQLSKEVVIRGFMWRQGESDTASPNTYYESDFNNMITLKFKANAVANGFTVDKCRIAISSLDCYLAQGPDRGPGLATLNSQFASCAAAAASEGLKGGTVISTVSCTVGGDGTHFNLAGQITQGFGFYNYYKDFTTE